ncbi:MAG: adaptor protein MecA [Eubacteriales bacterium]|nr:adaptor protein MecA [Eubacteriales bacterium]
MEFKKIGDRKFQCRLNAEDLEDNNISLDDFFNNDTEKIHDLLETIMEEAERNIGVTLKGDVMSLQLAPLPDHSILLTVSSGKDDFGSMLKRVGESFDKLGLPAEDIIDSEPEQEDEPKTKENTRKPVAVNTGVFRIADYGDFEQLCQSSARTWGVTNALYKDESDNTYYLILQKGRCSEEKYRSLLNLIMEYGEFDSSKEERAAFIKEHYSVIIGNNAINVVKKYM